LIVTALLLAPLPAMSQANAYYKSLTKEEALDRLIDFAGDVRNWEQTNVKTSSSNSGGLK